MADNIIDSLVVTLGLNAKGFQAAVDKAGTSVAGLAKNFAGTFLAIRGFEDAINYAKDLNKELVELHFTAQNLGLPATELSRWGEVAHLVGGQAQDAAASFQSLTSAVMGLRFQGQMSPQLMALQRLGVPYMNANGRMRDPGAISTDLAATLQRQFPDDKAARAYWAGQAGEQGGMLNAVVQGPAAVAKLLAAAAADQKNLTEKAIDSQVQLYQGVVRLENTVRANSADLLGQIAPALTELVAELRDISKIIDAVAHPVKFVEDTASKTFGPGSTLRQTYLPFLGNLFTGASIPGPRGIRNNNPLNLKAVGNQPRDAQGFAIFPSAAAGIAAAEQQLALYRSRGINTISGIISKWAPSSDGNDTAAYIKFVSQYLHRSPNAPVSSADYDAIVSAMSRFENGSRGSSFWKWLVPPGSAQVPSLFAPLLAPPSPGVARGGSAASNTTSMAGGTTVHIDSMVINAPNARDADDIVMNMKGALRRKLLVSNADVGLA